MSTRSSALGALLNELLESPSLREVTVPFSFAPFRAEDWKVEALDRTSDSTWILRASSPQGVEVEWHLRHFPDTRAIECHGVVRHAGTETVRGISGISTWDVGLIFNRDERLPWVRAFNGSFWMSTVFPPPDFSHRDFRLAETSQIYPGAPIRLASVQGGRSSWGTLPCQILANGPQTRGLACFLEWSGQWSIESNPTAVGYGTKAEQYEVGWKVTMEGIDLDLHPGQSFALPRILITAFSGNLDAGCRSLRTHIRRHVSPKLNGAEFLPPASFNHWFAYENEYTATSLEPAVVASATVGLDYFCVDGGWFSGGFRRGIGNWSEGDPAKFPQGIKPFSDWVRANGMKYGTWFEPEFAHQESELYRAHPDWFWPTPTVDQRPLDTSEFASFVDPEIHLLNFGLPEVRRWWIERFIRAYDEWGMRWVRWDCNQALRPNWEFGVPSGELGWRQMQHLNGLYETWENIREQCPELVIEQCASGGLRIDLGTIRNGHTFWMNDHTTNSDLVRAFQQNLNLILPGNYPNTNLCQNRDDYSDYDYFSHGCGGFGFSGRFEQMPAEAIERLRKFVARFKSYRHLLLEDYERPTGPMHFAEETSTVRFFNAAEEMSLTFNPNGKAGEFNGSNVIPRKSL